MAYDLRDETGNLKARFSNRVAGYIINNSKGHWLKKNFVSEVNANVFVLDDNISFGSIDDFGFKVFGLVGDYLMESK